MSTHLYYWNDGEVRYADAWLDNDQYKDYLSCFVVDTEFTDIWGRYGKVGSNSNSWTHVPKEQFPKLFLVHLLLLGID